MVWYNTKKAKKQQNLITNTTTTANNNTTTSATTTSGTYITNTSTSTISPSTWGTLVGSISSGSIGAGFYSNQPYQASFPEETLISFKFKDGTSTTLNLREYTLFIMLNQISPSECKDKAEYEEKMLVQKV
jgi:hypothetical protein